MDFADRQSDLFWDWLAVGEAVAKQAEERERDRRAREARKR